MQLTDAERASRKVARWHEERHDMVSAIYPYLLGEESDPWVVHFLKWTIRPSTNPIDELAEAWWWAEHAEQFEAEEEELRAQYGDPLMHIDVLKTAETALLTAQGEEPCD